jgi:hypothetical protein
VRHSLQCDARCDGYAFLLAAYWPFLSSNFDI